MGQILPHWDGFAQITRFICGFARPVGASSALSSPRLVATIRPWITRGRSSTEPPTMPVLLFSNATPPHAVPQRQNHLPIGRQTPPRADGYGLLPVWWTPRYGAVVRTIAILLGLWDHWTCFYAKRQLGGASFGGINGELRLNEIPFCSEGSELHRLTTDAGNRDGVGFAFSSPNAPSFGTAIHAPHAARLKLRLCKGYISDSHSNM